MQKIVTACGVWIRCKTIGGNLVFWMLVAVVLGCGKSGNDMERRQSEHALPGFLLPSPETMAVDLDVVASSYLRASLFLNQKDTTEKSRANHLQAMVHVSNVQARVVVPLTLPINLLKSVAGKSPVQNGVDSWIYSVEVSEGNRIWTANLSSVQLTSSATIWSMKVTSLPIDINDCCDDFLLFEGQSSTTGSGNWQIFDVTKTKKLTTLFSIVYDYNSPNEKALVFSMNSDLPNVRLRSGSTIKYEAKGSQRFLEIFDRSDLGKRLIVWNRVDKSGLYVDPQKNRVCWDSYLKDFSDKVCGGDSLSIIE